MVVFVFLRFIYRILLVAMAMVVRMAVVVEVVEKE